MGIVYVLEFDQFAEGGEASGKKVALKSYPLQAVMTDAGRALCQREGMVWLSLLPHPNVVKAIIFEISGGVPQILMEYVPGGNLRDRLTASGLPVSECLRVSLQICEAMIFLDQSAGIIHRDLKPENVLFSKEGSVKVTDFGIAGALTLTREATAPIIAGTPPYMAPEQFDATEAVDVRSDVYAFGIVLYEMLSGRRPFNAATVSGMREAHLSAVPDPLTDSAPEELRRIVQHCLHKRPDGSFPAFADVAYALGKVCEELGYTAYIPERLTIQQLEAMLDSLDWNNRGYGFRQLGKFDQALDCYRRSISTFRSKNEKENFSQFAPSGEKRDESALAGTYHNMGTVLMHMRRFDAAKEALNEALKIDPNQGIVYYRLGEIAMFERDYSNGLALVRKSVNCEPDNTDLLLKYVRLCYVHNEGAFEEGFSTFLKQAQIQSDVPLLVGTGCRFGDEAGPDIAIRCFNAALEIAPNNASAWFNKGVSLHRMGEASQALSAYERALQLNHDHPYARFYAGILTLMAGRDKEAIFHWEKLIGRTDIGSLASTIDLVQSVLKAGLPLKLVMSPFNQPNMIKYLG